MSTQLSPPARWAKIESRRDPADRVVRLRRCGQGEGKILKELHDLADLDVSRCWTLCITCRRWCSAHRYGALDIEASSCLPTVGGSRIERRLRQMGMMQSTVSTPAEVLIKAARPSRALPFGVPSHSFPLGSDQHHSPARVPVLDGFGTGPRFESFLLIKFSSLDVFISHRPHNAGTRPNVHPCGETVGDRSAAAPWCRLRIHRF